MTRREMLVMPAMALAAAPSTSFNRDFGDAVSAANAIRNKQISSVELTKHVFDRIDRYEPKLNAFVYELRDEAMARANQADAALAKRQSLGPLHGVPVHVKESFGVQGRPATWGIPQFRDAKAQRNSAAVEALLGAGAVLIGATNVPAKLRDHQSYNDIYGVTNNPWDLKRTPGGSSGGTAAALAAGLGFLGIGSDIGGSIRVPAHFCGIYGHKPTLGLVSEAGQMPGGMYNDSGFSTDLAVAGPMARSARDLDALLRILGGPEAPTAVAWSWKLPAPRHRSLRGMRIGYVFDDPMAPIDPDLMPLFEKVIHSLERAGATLKPGWPNGVKLAELNQTFSFLVGAVVYALEPSQTRAELMEEIKAMPNDMAKGALSSHADWMHQNLRRLAYRQQWRDYFQNIDVFLSPVAFTTAIPHTHNGSFGTRSVRTASGERRHVELLNWIGPATVTGCPATAAPIGNTGSGLPVAVQIMGPFWEDATPIAFAELLAREIGGFTPPPGFQS